MKLSGRPQQPPSGMNELVNAIRNVIPAGVTLDQLRDSGIRIKDPELVAKHIREHALASAAQAKGGAVRIFEGDTRRHSAWVDDVSRISGIDVLHKPIVKLSNDDDSFYVQTFHNWDAVGELVAQLIASGMDAFGPPNDEWSEFVADRVDEINRSNQLKQG